MEKIKPVGKTKYKAYFNHKGRKAAFKRVSKGQYILKGDVIPGQTYVVEMGKSPLNY